MSAFSDYKPALRGVERWTQTKPEAVACGSKAMIFYALADARHEILELHKERTEIARNLRMIDSAVGHRRIEGGDQNPKGWRDLLFSSASKLGRALT